MSDQMKGDRMTAHQGGLEGLLTRIKADHDELMELRPLKKTARLRAPRWIPVTERLPEPKQYVIGWVAADAYAETLVFDEDGCCWCVGSGNRWPQGVFEKVITHWQPIEGPNDFNQQRKTNET